MTSVILNLRVENLDRVRHALGQLTGKQAKEAYAKAVNDAAFRVQREMRKALRSSFDRVTPHIERSPRFDPATADRLSTAVLPTMDARNKPSKGGKVGVDPQYILQAQEFGGRRADKKSEVVLRRAGFLPMGMQTAIPRDPFPGSDDGRGNLRASFVVKLLSYLQAFGEVGFRSNLTDKSAARRKDIDVFSNIQTRRQVRLMGGWEFFVSEGRGSIKSGRDAPGGGRVKVFEHSRRQNLRAGVWARQGKQIKPVIMFVSTPTYKARISMDEVAKNADLQNYLDKRVRFRIREAAGI